MKRIVALTVVMMFSACTQVGNSVGQQGTQNPDPKPDPVITTPINSRFVGRIAATIGGDAKDFDAILEFREKQAGRLIGFAQLRDKPLPAPLFLDFWQEGQRNNADVTFDLRISGESCVSIKIKGKLDVNGDIAVPKTEQSICSVSKAVTQAFILKREGDPKWSWWKAIEAHFAPK
jgi:hypothetical protein